MRNNFLLRASIACVCFAVACTTADRRLDDTNTVSTQLPPLDNSSATIALDETAETFIGVPAGIAISDRFIFVSDASSSSVIQYDRNGRIVRRIGRRGKGPGEFSVPGAIAVLGDTAILVADMGTGRLSVFTADSGTYLFARTFPGAPFTVSISADTVLGGTFNAMQKQSMYRMTLSDSIGKAFGPVSNDYVEGQRLQFTYPFSAATLSNGGTTVGMVGSNRLYRTGTEGAITDSVLLLSRTRRGIPPELDDKIGTVKEPGGEMLLVSILTALTSLGTSTALVHMDFSPNGQSVSARGFLSIIDWSDHRQCVDAEVALGDDSRPIFAFRGDSLVVVQNVVSASDSTSTTTTVRMFKIPACPKS